MKNAIHRLADHRHPARGRGRRHVDQGPVQEAQPDRADLFCWRNKFGGLDVPDARRLKDLESEKARLKRLVAEQMLVIDGMKEIVRKK